jgi:hypothetical protein
MNSCATVIQNRFVPAPPLWGSIQRRQLFIQSKSNTSGDNVELAIFSLFVFTDEFLIPELISDASIVRLVPSAPSTDRLAAVTSAASAHHCFMVVAQPARLLAVF